MTSLYQQSKRTIQKRLTKRWASWLSRRIPASHEVKLNQRSIFIVPSKTGWLFCLLLVLMLITAINYQNSLIYGLTFWLFSFALSAMIFTYRNLSGLTIKTSQKVSGFSGDTIEVPIRISDSQRSHQGLVFSWPQHTSVTITSEVHKNQEKEIFIPYPLDIRGHLKTERLRLESRYPFGLYKAWTWLQLKTPGIIFPSPIHSPYLAGEGEGDDEPRDANLQVGNDEFIGLRSYQKGDSLKHIAWKYLAKGKGLLSKEYDNQQLSMQWFDWHSLHGQGVEDKLSHLTGWVLQAEREGRAYGLRLPNTAIAPSNGDQHRDYCLSQLALFGKQEQGID